MIKSIFSLLFIFSVTIIQAQEICNNGIDDDADGLVDLNDAADCVCSGIGGGGGPVPSLIPNASFENMSCCPSSYSQVNCAQGWVQASDPTSDYMNTCGMVFNAATAAGLVPFPNGNGIVGAIFDPGWQEYVGSCLTAPMTAGTSYTIEFNIASTPIDGYGDVCNGGVINFGAIDISIFGTGNCANLPFSGTGCPGSGSGYDLLGSVSYSPVSSWGLVSITFTPTQNINAIVLGSPCTLPPDYNSGTLGGCYPYFYFDNLVLNNSALFTPVSVTPSGDICSGNASATATAGSAGGTWQWFFNGVAIVGQTSATINVSAVGLGAGDYTAMYTLSGQCDIATTTFAGGAGDPTITQAGPFCTNSGLQNLAAATGGGTWTASCVGCINSSTGQFNPANATIGSNTITYTLGGACPAVDNMTIVVETAVISSTGIADVSCFGLCDGEIVINSTGATQFSIDGGATFQASNTFTGLCAGTYNIVVESATAGCTASATATIQTPAQLTLPTSFVDVTCFGSCDGSAVVAPQGGSSPYDYTWSNGAPNSPTNNNLCAGTYTVDVTDDNGCTASANITVSSPPQVVINSIIEVDESCMNACDGSITINAPAATQFSIDNGATFQASTIFNGICSGNYDVVVEDANGCQSTGIANISTPNPISITPGANSTICIGQSATLSASANGGSGGLTLIWDNGLPNGSPQTVSPLTTTTYSVYAEDANGCSTNPVQITVTVNPPLQVNALSDQSICPGDVAVITANASGGNGGPYTYVWNDGSSNLNGQTQNVSPAVTTTYTVTATDNCGTPAVTDAVTITVNPTPVVTFTADDLQGCEPHNVNFTNTTNAADVGTCFWDFGDGTTSTSCNPNHVYTTPGCYTVTLTVTSPAGCVGTQSVTNMICVTPMPVADFTAGPQPTNLFDTDISFVNLSQNGATYLWDFGAFGTSNSVNPPNVYYPDSVPGTYPVCLIATSVDNCTDTFCMNIVIDDIFLLYVPNSFTPDNDNINELFYPVISGFIADKYEFMIFNRWGELIFLSESAGAGWDGRHKGLECKEDTYVWKLKAKESASGKQRTYYGHVNLLR